ncbi:hydroxymethylbilane synthase [Sphingosinicella sp. CPCC 101087]|uniref:hydroxymethylbilane synthase n=1 Tax=Sphingosinicella sp. CPCC 101087 TaxID=2497754 RepID=UPI00101B82B1|nr:hydroxymethylbilane synthase [Sphingosinicella sp. CPCC 101087]
MDRPLRIGTRGSPLALAQAHMVANALRAHHGWPEEAVEIVPITTSGDRIQDRPLAEVGGKALWTKELDRCLLDGRTDLSVHSMKDVETVRPEMLTIPAMLPRADPRDRLVGADSVAALPHGARVGTSSPRRSAQLLARRPDLRIVTMRGNVQTRLAKLERGEADATLLAAAGLERVGLSEVGTVLDDMIPAPSQGAIGIEVLAQAEGISKLVRPIDHAQTHRCIDAERAFLAAVGGDCRSAVAAHARCIGGGIRLRAEILLPDGSEVRGGEGEDPAALARKLLSDASPGLRALFAG